MGGDVQGQRGDVDVEEAVEGAADSVVIESGELVVRQAKPLGGVPCGPYADAIERFAPDEEIPGEYARYTWPECPW
jgi:hypothetical protein